MNILCCFCFYKRVSDTEPPMNLTNILVNWENTVPFVPPIDKGLVIKVYDGDTITIAARLPYLGSPLYRFQVRLKDIDSPEMRGKTQDEKDAAKLSQRALSDLILNKTVYLKDCANEKYGRLLANVYVDIENGSQIHINQWMIENGYAISYDGGKKAPFHKRSAMDTIYEES